VVAIVLHFTLIHLKQDMSHAIIIVITQMHASNKRISNYVQERNPIPHDVGFMQKMAMQDYHRNWEMSVELQFLPANNSNYTVPYLVPTCPEIKHAHYWETRSITF
jgi:hypothetical protein